MKTKNRRLEELEQKDTSIKNFYVIREKLESDGLFEYKNERGEVELMTLEKAREKFDGEDSVLLVIQYDKDWGKWKREAVRNGDLLK